MNQYAMGNTNTTQPNDQPIPYISPTVPMNNPELICVEAMLAPPTAQCSRPPATK
jgi:hypothetical protein